MVKTKQKEEPVDLDSQLITLFKIKDEFKKNPNKAKQLWSDNKYKTKCTDTNIDKTINRLTWRTIIPISAQRALYLLKLTQKYDLKPLSVEDLDDLQGNRKLQDAEFKFQSIADNIGKQKGDGSQQIAVANHSADTALGISIDANNPKYNDYELYTYDEKSKTVHLTTYGDISRELNKTIHIVQKLA